MTASYPVYGNDMYALWATTATPLAISLRSSSFRSTESPSCSCFLSNRDSGGSTSTTLPCLIFSILSMHLRSVVFPQPFCPRIPTILPESASKVMFSRASLLP